MKRAGFHLIALVALAIGLISFGGIATAHGDSTPEASPSAGMGGGESMDGMDEMGGTGAAFMTIANKGSESDHLIAGKTDVATTVEIHEMFEKDGVMVMQPVPGGIEVPAGGSVVLEPGGYHVMLIGLTKDLTEGMTFDLTLTFEEAGDVTVSVTVERQAPAADASAAVEVGDLTITSIWSRPAPALLGTPVASPEASPTM